MNSTTKFLLYALLLAATFTAAYMINHPPSSWLFAPAFGDSCEKKNDPHSGVLLCGNGHGAVLVAHKINNTDGNQVFLLYSYDVFPYRVRLSDIGPDGAVYDQSVVRVKPDTLIEQSFDGPKDSYLIAKILPFYR